MNYTPWGLDNEIPIGSSLPGTVSMGKPAVTNGMGVAGVGTLCSNCFSVPAGTGAYFNPINNGIGPTVPGSAATLTWAQLQTHRGRDEPDRPAATGLGIVRAAEKFLRRHSGPAAVTGPFLLFHWLYANSRVNERTPNYYLFAAINDIHTFAVPTTNPYYPAGRPRGPSGFL